MVFWRAKFLILVKLNLSVFPLWIVLFLTSVKILCLTLDTKDFLILFKKFYILYLTHFKLHFIYSVRLRLRFLFILMSVQYCTFVKKLGHICVGVFLGFLFDPSSVYVHTTLSSYLSYILCLTIGYSDPSHFFFLFTIVLSILGPRVFSYKF